MAVNPEDLAELDREMVLLKQKFLLLHRLIQRILKELIEIDEKLIRMKRPQRPPEKERQTLAELKRLARAEVRFPREFVDDLDRLIERLERQEV
jgi:hypothetical protein